MAAGESTRAVITALAANLGIAVSKLVAGVITGSSSMLAEAVHSVADSANQGLLLIGGKRAMRAASPLHPFGYARERYVYAFLVSIVLFTIGGLYALYEGYLKVTEPHQIRSPLVAVAVLLIAMALEGYALHTAVGVANRTRGRQSWAQFIRRARAPEVPVILLEDSGALVGLTLALLGVGLTVWTGNGIFDGLATLGIGALLVAIALVLGRETKSLLIGESATKDQLEAIGRALLAEPDFDRIIHLRTVHLGPDELLVAAKVAVARDDDAEDVAEAIDRAEARIRKAVPAAKIIYIEPDIYRPSTPRG